MHLKRLLTAKLLAASTFGLYLFDYRKAWAGELPIPEPPAALIELAEPSDATK